LAAVYDIEIVTLGIPGTPPCRTQLGRGVWETRIPKSLKHAHEEARIEREVGTLVTDIAFSRLFALTPDYVAALRKATSDVRAVIASHPYALPAIFEVTERPLWYDAHNVESLLKADVLPQTAAGSELLRAVEEVERAACERSELVWTCSEEDRAQLITTYALEPDCALVVPNGVSLDELTYVRPSERDEHKRMLGMGAWLSVFMGSWHGPNVVAASRVVDVAMAAPDLHFMIVGSVGRALNGQLPVNVDIAGLVSSEFRRELLGIADLALNPVTTGSGTNLKMLDYFAAGIPVVSTSFGARGLGVAAGRHYVSADPESFGDAIESVRTSGPHARDALSAAAREHISAKLSWPVIGGNLLAALLSRG
jgi:glycosyltransferase involved in cell wall biosynthesis